MKVNMIDEKEISDAEFNEAIKNALKAGVTHKDIAREMTMNIITVERWTNGRNFPHPAMRPLVIRKLNELTGSN